MEINEVKELLNQFNDSNLTEFDLREGSFELYMNKNQTSRQTAAPSQTEQSVEAPVAVATSTSSRRTSYHFTNRRDCLLTAISRSRGL